MGGGVYYLALIFLRPGKEETLREYERHARPIMRRHGGEFERVLKPLVADPKGSGPHEVHLLRFASESGFEAFRNDPDLQSRLTLRDAAVERAELLTLTEIALPEYFGAAG